MSDLNDRYSRQIFFKTISKDGQRQSECAIYAEGHIMEFFEKYFIDEEENLQNVNKGKRTMSR